LIRSVDGPAVLDVIRAAAWDARPPARRFEEMTPRVIVIHHTVTPNPPHAVSQGTRDGAANLARRIQADHMDRRGWADSGHNVLVTTGGFVLEGRHGSLAAIEHGRCVQSAHTIGANDSPGIENEGDFSVYAMAPVQWDRLVATCAFICEACGFDPEVIRGHRDFDATRCPGDWLYAQLPRLRQDVRARLSMLASPGTRRAYDAS
jgi:hypothetical protein